MAKARLRSSEVRRSKPKYRNDILPMNPEKPYVLLKHIEELYKRITVLERKIDRTQGCLIDMGRTLERHGG